MATIRIPASAEPLLPFCRTSGTPGPHFWETYADMVTFLAAYAYGHDELLSTKLTHSKTANSIDLGVFRSRGLYPILLTIAIADQRDWLIAKQADNIAATVERYAAAGAHALQAEQALSTTEYLTQHLLKAFNPDIAKAPMI